MKNAKLIWIVKFYYFDEIYFPFFHFYGTRILSLFTANSFQDMDLWSEPGLAPSNRVLFYHVISQIA